MYLTILLQEKGTKARESSPCELPIDAFVDSLFLPFIYFVHLISNTTQSGQCRIADELRLLS